MTSSNCCVPQFIIKNAIGLQGPCTMGPPGPRGIQGIQGLDGAQGAQGIQGIPGAQGPTGAEGPQGIQGPAGPLGPPGQGVPSGGTTGQVLVKLSNTSYHTGWSSAYVPYTGATANLNLGAFNILAANAFVDNVFVTDEAYSGAWNGSLEVPTKNALYDKIQTVPALNVANTWSAVQSNTTYFVNDYNVDWNVSNVYLARAGNSGASGSINFLWSLGAVRLKDDAGDFKILEVEALIAQSISVEDVFFNNAGIVPGGVFFSGPSTNARNDYLNFFYDDTNNRLGLGTSTPAARIHSISTTEPLRLGYNSTQYLSVSVSSSGGVTYDATGTTPTHTFPDQVIFNAPARLKGYTVATLPASPVQGDMAYVTDGNAPTFLSIIAGGGAVITPVFYNGTNWVAH